MVFVRLLFFLGGGGAKNKFVPSCPHQTSRGFVPQWKNHCGKSLYYVALWNAGKRALIGLDELFLPPFFLYAQSC